MLAVIRSVINIWIKLDNKWFFQQSKTHLPLNKLFKAKIYCFCHSLLRGEPDMSEVDLLFLGNRIIAARKVRGLTQKELAMQIGLSPKTVQAIEKGHKNPTYKTLLRLVAWLGISPNTLFPIKMAVEDEELQRFVWKFQSCNPENQKMVLNVLNFLAEQLLERERESERSE